MTYVEDIDLVVRRHKERDTAAALQAVLDVLEYSDHVVLQVGNNRSPMLCRCLYGIVAFGC